MNTTTQPQAGELTQYTPGPWRFTVSPQPNGCPIVGAGGLMVCMLAHSVHAESQAGTAIANARLIAAAPELLERLATLINDVQEWVNAVQEDASWDGWDGYYKHLAYGGLDAARAAIAKAKGGREG